ncbi:MAG: hypothetical protein MJY52_04085 [Bacteroidaceae bacterium]|nr:hypothetical protein [Bacteroidaceae bacterium]
MGKVIASDSIVKIAGVANTSGKLNMWAKILKWFIIICAVIFIILGLKLTSIGVSEYSADLIPIGIVLILFGFLQGFFAFFYVYVLRAFAIITEAASIIVLEHQSGIEEEQQQQTK